jgi:hypothetical protein
VGELSAGEQSIYVCPCDTPTHCRICDASHRKRALTVVLIVCVRLLVFMLFIAWFQIYRDKIKADGIADEMGVERLTMPAFIKRFFANRYGVEDIIKDTTQKLIATLNLYKSTNVYCKTFARIWALPELQLKPEIRSSFHKLMPFYLVKASCVTTRS